MLGRKTDISDAEWIAKLLRSGLIEGCFVPPQDIRELRDLTRHRKKMVNHATAEKNRIQKVLESAGIKLGSVISDVFGVTGRALLQQLMQNGRLDRDTITSLVKGQIKKKIPQLLDALHSKLSSHHRFLLNQSWQHLTHLEQSIERFDAEIDQHLEPYRLEMELLQSIPGVDVTAASAILAEVGADMLQFLPFRSSYRVLGGTVSGQLRKCREKKSSRILHGNPHLKSVLAECAWAASRTKKTYLAARYWKLAARRGKKKALIATAHKILTILYHLLLQQRPYIERSDDYLEQLHQRTRAKRLLKQLESLGYNIELKSTPEKPA